MNEENQNINNEENIQVVQPNNNEMSNQTNNENQETKNSSKTTKVLLVIFIIISLLLAGYIVYDKTSEHKEPIPVPEKDNAGEEKNEIDPKLYIGAYGGKRLVSDSDGKQESYNDSLYLREDGSFYLVIGDQVCGTNISGTYKVDGETLTLEKTVSYGCDACFFKESKVYTANINNNGIVKLSYEDETLELKKGTIEVEDSRSLAWYVSNPVDGVTPEGWGESWGDCTNKANN